MREATDVAAICERLLDVCAPKSIRIRVEIQQTTTGPDEVFEFPIKQEWAATSSGQRYFDDWFMAPAGKAFEHRAVYCDGHKFAHVWLQQQDPARQSLVSFNKEVLLEKRDFFLDAPMPIKITRVGLVPLYEALPTAESMPDGKVIGRACDVFYFKSAGKPSNPASIIYHLDKETSYPLKVVFYNNPERVRAGRPNSLWEAKTFDRVSGRHFLPLSSVYSDRPIDLGVDKSDSKVCIYQSIRIVHAEFDAAIPSSAFWPIPQPGVRLIDNTSRPSASKPGADVTIPQAAQAADPIRAAVPGNSSALLALSGAALSVAVLLIAVLLWKRGR
jgi:hypothetical protein